MDLVMVGDGSGQLGAEIYQQLSGAGLVRKLIHLDPGWGMLQLQEKTYVKAGIPKEKIVGVRGSIVTGADQIKRQVPDYNAGFFVLHEIFDTLRTHAMVSGGEDGQIGELYAVFDRQPKLKGLVSLAPSHPSVAAMVSALPLYESPRGLLLNKPFTPEIFIAMREMLGSADHVAIYAGDYANQFIRGEQDIRAYSDQLSIRVSTRSESEPFEYDKILIEPSDFTADVWPAAVYFGELFGGRVEQLTTMAEFIGMADPALAGRIPDELARIKTGLENGFPYADAAEARQDALFFNQLASPAMFAAVITKGL